MLKLLNKESAICTSIGLFLIRLVFGGTMAIAHGLPKFQNWAEYSTQFPDPFGVGSAASLGMAVFGELICGLLVVLGLFTRLALIPLIITMAVAFFMIHGADPWQKKELAFVYLSVYVALFCTGPGALSVDQRMK